MPMDYLNIFTAIMSKMHPKSILYYTDHSNYYCSIYLSKDEHHSKQISLTERSAAGTGCRGRLNLISSSIRCSLE